MSRQPRSEPGLGHERTESSRRSISTSRGSRSAATSIHYQPYRRPQRAMSTSPDVAIGTIERVDPQGKSHPICRAAQRRDPSCAWAPNDRLYAYSCDRTGDIVSVEALPPAWRAIEKTVHETIAGPRPASPTLWSPRTEAIYFLDSSKATIGVIDAAGQRARCAALDRCWPTRCRRPRVSPSRPISPCSSSPTRIRATAGRSRSPPMARSKMASRSTGLSCRRPRVLAWQSEHTAARWKIQIGMVYFATPLGYSDRHAKRPHGGNSEPADSRRRAADGHHFCRDRRQNWLYAAQDGKLYRRPVKVTGANAWTVVKPPKPTL